MHQVIIQRIKSSEPLATDILPRLVDILANFTQTPPAAIAPATLKGSGLFRVSSEGLALGDVPKGAQWGRDADVRIRQVVMPSILPGSGLAAIDNLLREAYFYTIPCNTMWTSMKAVASPFKTSADVSEIHSLRDIDSGLPIQLARMGGPTDFSHPMMVEGKVYGQDPLNFLAFTPLSITAPALADGRLLVLTSIRSYAPRHHSLPFTVTSLLTDPVIDRTYGPFVVSDDLDFSALFTDNAMEAWLAE